MQLVAKNEKEAGLFVKWICLNNCDFWGNDEAVIAHKRVLRSCRTSVAKALGVKPTEVPSEALDMYRGNEEFTKELKRA
jgi:hypothetical protein